MLEVTPAEPGINRAVARRMLRDETHGQIPDAGALRPRRQGVTVAPGSEGRTLFDQVYDQPDPRPFFRTLRPLEYQTPHHAQGVFRRMVAACQQLPRTAGPITVLDICCSYGINAALLNHDLTLDDLYAHYTCPQAAALTTAELMDWDRRYYAARRRIDAVPVTGLDVSANAISYARAVGLLDEAFAENLEAAPPSPGLLRVARLTRLITVTGGVSFLSPRTFQSLLDVADGPVWVATFVLRTGSYRSIAEGLAPYGLITERDSAHTFPQRRFTSPGEQRYAIHAAMAAGEDPHGKEADGYFHTTVYLSRRPEDIASLPLRFLVRPA